MNRPTVCKKVPPSRRSISPLRLAAALLLAPVAAWAAAGTPAASSRPNILLLYVDDDAIGRVLDTVDDLNLRERTLVMLISDNGAFMLPGRGLEVASNAPLRDGGTTCYEGGVRVPALFRWPGRITPGTEVGEMLSQLDVLPLCLEVSGAPALPGRVVDGRNPLPTLSGAAKSPHQRLAFAYNNGTGLREGSLKIVGPAEGKPWELYDLSTDLAESKDLAADHATEVARLDQVFQAWLADIKIDASPPAPRPMRRNAAAAVP